MKKNENQQHRPLSVESISLRFVPRMWVCIYIVLQFIREVLITDDNSETQAKTQSARSFVNFDSEASPEDVKLLVIQCIETLYPLPENVINNGIPWDKRAACQQIDHIFNRSFSFLNRIRHCIRQRFFRSAEHTTPLETFKNSSELLFNEILKVHEQTETKMRLLKSQKDSMEKIVKRVEGELRTFLDESVIFLEFPEVQNVIEVIYEKTVSDEKKQIVADWKKNKDGMESVFDQILEKVLSIFDNEIDDIMVKLPPLDPPSLRMELEPHFYSDHVLSRDNKHAFSTSMTDFTQHNNVLPPGIEALYELKIGIHSTDLQIYNGAAEGYKVLIANGHVLHTKSGLAESILAAEQQPLPEPIQQPLPTLNTLNGNEAYCFLVGDNENTPEIVRFSEIGQYISKKRQAQGLTETELAEKSGVHVRTVTNWEANRHVPTGAKLQAVFTALNCRIFVQTPEADISTPHTDK